MWYTSKLYPNIAHKTLYILIHEGNVAGYNKFYIFDSVIIITYVYM